MWEVLCLVFFLGLLVYQWMQPSSRLCTIRLESTFRIRMTITHKNPEFLFQEALTNGFWNSELSVLCDDFEFLDDNQQLEIFLDEADRFFKEHQGWCVDNVENSIFIYQQDDSLFKKFIATIEEPK